MSERTWKSKVGCHLIMKNEAKNIERCLGSMKGWADVTVIVDTGSDDGSVEIAEKMGAVVKKDSWYDDFGKSRNMALDFLYETYPEVDWVVWCDLDDILMSPDDANRFREILDQYLDDPKVECLNFPYIYTHQAGEVGNQSIPEFKYYRLRAFKKGTANWTARIHEYLHSDGSKHVNPVEPVFHHFREGTGMANTARNLRILRKVYDDAKPEEKARYAFYLGKECMYNGLYDEAITHFKFYLPISNFPAEKIRALYELAVCYKTRGEINEAKKWAFESIMADQRYPDPYVLLGQIAYDQQDWRMCVNWMQIAPNLDRAETYFFDYMPMQTWMPQDYMTACYWNIDREKGKETIAKCLYYKPFERRYLYNWDQFHPEVGKVGIIIPTLNRKEKLQNCIAKIKENAYMRNIEFFIGVDGNEECFNSLNEIYKDETKMNIVLFEEHVGVPTVVEELIKHAEKSECKYITYLGDDTEPLVGFLIHAYLACEDKNLVCYNDKVWNGEIACHWFAPVSLKEKLGGFFFYKGYNHVGCDNELTDKAKKLGLYKYAENAFVDHVHYIKDICSDKSKVAEKDECYTIAWDEEKVAKDRAILAIRKANNYIADTEEVKVNIGAGSTKKEGYITIDKFAEADIKADIMTDNVFLDNTVDKILSEHVLEHFTQQDGIKFVRTCYKALKKFGELEIAVPDIEFVQAVQDIEYRTKVIYGWQLPGMHHKWGYTQDSLEKLLKNQGFNIKESKKTFEYDAPSIRVVATK